MVLLHYLPPSRLFPSGVAGRTHSAEELAAIGLLTFTKGDDRSHKGRETERGTVAGGSGSTDSAGASHQSLVPTGPGLPALPRKLVERIHNNEYVDFAELPPAKGRSRTPAPVGEGQILVLQAGDVTPSRRAIPELATWIQCYGIYVAVLTSRQPHRSTELMAYQSIVAKASARYKWPSWVIYDQSFRQEMASTPGQSWARVDPTIYSLCFYGQNVSTENWCPNCQTMDHLAQECPVRGKKRSWATAADSPKQVGRGDVCLKFNCFQGDCKFGRTCRFRHVCSVCREPHPASHCKKGEKRPRNGDNRGPK